MKLSIVTPCDRPENLPRMLPTIPEGAEWIVVMDRSNCDDVPPAVLRHPLARVMAHEGGSWGNRQRNLGMWEAAGDFVYFLDDDNIIHPNLMPLLDRVTGVFREPALVMDQVNADGSLRMRATFPAPGRVDTAQVVLPRFLALGAEWADSRRDADGQFFFDVLVRRPDLFVGLNEPGCFYNYLRDAA